MTVLSRMAAPENTFRLLREATDRLQQAGIENASFEARQLLAHAAGIRSAGLLTLSGNPISSQQVYRFRELLRERITRRPLQYILGEWDFRGLRLALTPDVLVPRPETEELAEIFIERFSSFPGPAVIADAGTGSGCLAVSFAKEIPLSRVWAVDLSGKALAVAKTNANAHEVSDRIEFLQGDLLQPLIEKGVMVDAVVANLPYIPSGDIPGLDPEVQQEPLVALDGGPDGLSLVKRLLPQAFMVLKHGGFLALEFGFDQADRIAESALAAGFNAVERRKDFAGVERFVIAVKE